mgnify:CR=1 FL=1
MQVDFDQISFDGMICAIGIVVNALKGKIFRYTKYLKAREIIQEDCKISPDKFSFSLFSSKKINFEHESAFCVCAAGLVHLLADNRQVVAGLNTKHPMNYMRVSVWGSIEI